MPIPLDQVGPVANLCRSCNQDFGSVTAFGKHRIGKHEYTFREGMEMEPYREDGRRCLDTEELTEMGWAQDKRGRWRLPAPVDASVRFTQRRRAPATL